MAQTLLEKALEHHKVETGITTAEIAELLGVTRQTLWAKVRGYTPLDLKQAKQLADLLGVTLEQLYAIAPKVEE